MMNRFLVALVLMLAAYDNAEARTGGERGSYIVLELDSAALQRQQLENLSDQMSIVLRDAEPVILNDWHGVVGDAARIRIKNPDDMERARGVLREIAHSPGNEIVTYTEGAEGLIEARTTPAHLRELTRQAARQSIEVIRRRIDPEGIHDISISMIGDDRIRIELPSSIDLGAFRRLFGLVGALTFNMVREIDPTDAQTGRIPPGTMVVQPYPGIGDGPEVVERRPRFTGERLAMAAPSSDVQTGEIVLSFRLDNTGARLFCRITRDYTGQRFAILLDNQVLTAPTINELICGGSGQISGNFTAESAHELAQLLRAGALPVPLSMIEEGLLPN